ncbi:MAG: S-layer homology domain-containing protein [Pseudonocardiales bacterium]|nr:S-layer homology domain-containing protein [Pseudonocardiales bacterium]
MSKAGVWSTAESRRVTSGYPDGTFHPTASIERQATAAFIHRPDLDTQMI